MSERDADALFQGLERIAGLAVAHQTVDAMLEVVVTLAKKLVPGSNGAGVSLRKDGRWITAAQTDDFVLEVDAKQYERESGPCVAAAKDDRVYRVDDMTKEQRWPGFADDASASGVRSVLSTPLSAGAAPTGALNIYAFEVNAFDEHSETIASVLARHATIALENKEALGNGELLTSQLRAALESRDLIGQAKGILMERDGLTSDEAFDMLRKMSQSQNRKLRTIANEIVDSAREPSNRDV